MVAKMGDAVVVHVRSKMAGSGHTKPWSLSPPAAAMAAAAALLFSCAVLSGPAMAGKADVVDVKIAPEGTGTYRFAVTIRSDDRGWDKYADKWEILAPDGRVLGTRVLVHPHDDEQPFTRDLDAVAIPPDVASVRVRAHDKVEGWGGLEKTVAVPR